MYKETHTHEEHLSIVAQGLTKRFGSFTAVDNISFNVKKGEIFGFLGANGAGKTTAMKMLCGLSKPTSGNATVAGFDVSTQSEQIKKNIGYMSQKFALYEDLKVWENMRLYAGIYGLNDNEIKSRTDEILQQLDFQNERNTLVKALPLGWKQKLAFSISIIHQPDIVFLDEPTGGVDPAARRQFWELIYQTADKGITVFVTTHYMDEADSLCDRVVILDQGKILDMGTPNDLKSKIHGDIILNIKVEDPDDGDIKLIQGLSTVTGVDVVDNQYTISLRSKKDINDIINVFEGDILSINTKEPTLEDVFINSFKQG